MPAEITVVQSGTKKLPDRILLYGTEGIGKSTFAAGAKEPLFLDLEDGLANLGVPCIPCPNYSTAIMAVENFPAGYFTLVIDTADALEIKIYEFLCTKFGWSSIEDPGYGKGYVAAGERMREFIAKLDVARKKGIEIIFLAHAEIKNFANPAGPDYSRYSPKMNKNCLAPIKEWCDNVFFAAHDETAAIRKGESKAKGQGSGNRVIHTAHTPAFDAKTRLTLPKVIPLSYQAYVSAKNGAKAQSLAPINASNIVVPVAPETTLPKSVARTTPTLAPAPALTPAPAPTKASAPAPAPPPVFFDAGTGNWAFYPPLPLAPAPAPTPATAPAPAPTAAPTQAPAPAPAPAKASAKTVPITRQEIGECLIEWQNVSGEKEISATVKKFIVAIGYPKLGMVPHAEYFKIIKLLNVWYIEQGVSALPPKLSGALAKI